MSEWTTGDHFTPKPKWYWVAVVVVVLAAPAFLLGLLGLAGLVVPLGMVVGIVAILTDRTRRHSDDD